LALPYFAEIFSVLVVTEKRQDQTEEIMHCLKLSHLFIALFFISFLTYAWGEQSLPEVVVTALRLPPPDTTKKTVINGKNMSEKQQTFVATALRNSSHVIINRYGLAGRRSTARIRGAKGNQTLVLMNGLPLNNPAMGGEFDFADLLSSDIASIEIIPGSQGVLYGANAVGGVINIQTKKWQGPLQINAQKEVSSYKTRLSALNVSGSTEKVSYYLGGTVYRSGQGVFTNRKYGNSQGDDYHNQTVQIRLGLEPMVNFQLEGTFNFTNVEVKTDRYFGLSFPTETNDRSKKQKFSGGLVATIHTFNDRLKSSLSLMRSENCFDFFKKDKKINSNQGGYTTVRYDADAIIHSQHHLRWGLEHLNEEAQSTALRHKQLETNSVFALYDFSPLSDLTLKVGGRYSRHQTFGGHVMYQLGALYDFDHTNLCSNLSNGYKSPTPSDIYGAAKNALPNYNLKPEKNRTFDIGIDHTFKVFKTTIGITYFHLIIDDLISADFLPGNRFQAVNRHKRRTHGIEAGLLTQPLPRLTIDMLYTYTKARDCNTKRHPIRTPYHKLSASLNYQSTKELTLFLGFIYVGQARDFSFSSFPAHLVTLGDYFLVRAGGDYTLSEHFKIYGHIDNIFNEAYEHIYGYGTRGRSVDLGLKLAY
jgi:vitamin B12 transporter